VQKNTKGVCNSPQKLELKKKGFGHLKINHFILVLRFYKIFNKYGLNFIFHIFIYSLILFIKHANRIVGMENNTDKINIMYEKCIKKIEFVYIGILFVIG